MPPPRPASNRRNRPAPPKLPAAASCKARACRTHQRAGGTLLPMVVSEGAHTTLGALTGVDTRSQGRTKVMKPGAAGQAEVEMAAVPTDPSFAFVRPAQLAPQVPYAYAAVVGRHPPRVGLRLARKLDHRRGYF